MGTISAGARRLPLHHVTIRVPWHDGGWTGSVCARPLDNTSCLILPRVGEGRRDEVEARCAAQRLDDLDRADLPPCVGERVSFMAPFALTRTMTHPYTEFYPETHGHFAATRFVQPAYSAACVPYRWMLREKVEGNAKDGEIGLAERLKIGWVPDREPDIRNHQGKEVETDWIQERENQLALLDTFFGALRPEDSLCFFYAKRTPLSEQSRRVIVGVGRVLSVGEATEYSYKGKERPLRCVLWERNVGHSVRPGFADGFLFPYQEALGLAEREGIDPEEFVAFAPDEHFDAYSYGSELLSHDGAVASLVTCAATLHRIRGRIEGPWDHALAWIDTQLNRLWRARGAFPGLGSALSAFGYEWGFQHGSLLAYEIELLREREGGGDPWSLLDAVMDNPAKLGGPLAKLLTDGLRKGWKRLADDRRALLQLLGRCAVSEDQALRMYDTTARMEVGIEANDAELLRNPYLFFERDRRAADPIAFGAVDRGLFPDEAVREELPVPEPSLVEDPALIDALSNVERLVLVGDPRQLPPIGAGRPFVDIVRELEPENVERLFPRCRPGYAELTIPRRQRRGADVFLASHFSGRPLDPGADALLDETEEVMDGRLRRVRWDHPQELQEKLVAELVEALELAGPNDELGFEESLGGARHGDIPWSFFWSHYRDNPGAAARAEDWQMLSPVRAGLAGVDALNRMVQARFRAKVRELAEAEGWSRKVPRPIGPQTLLYGDKVINVINQRRRDVWPKPDGEAYLANGDIGIVVGQYKTRKLKGMPWKLEVEFAGQLGPKYGFYPGEFGDEGRNPLELAYCLTVHKTQGSEFGVTFVVLTNPCWLLSRELLYTAVTRHEDRLVILHQGPLVEYRRYAGDEYSEIARRMTNLFADPLPREVVVNAQQRFLEEGLIHRTERGDLVRSKSELVIADKLHARGIDYAYEQPLVLSNGRTRYPDFTIADHARGVTFYWEHLGMLHDPGYKARWDLKRTEYLECGIGPHEDGGGPEGTLIESRDQPGGRLDAAAIASVIDGVILGEA